MKVLEYVKKTIKENKISIVISILIYIYSIYTTNHYFNFSYSDFGMFAWFRYLLIRGIFVILDFTVVYYISNIIKKLIKKDKDTKNLLIFFAIALLINMILLLMLWPGNWINDELGVLYEARQFNYYSWQNYLTVIFFSVCVMALPTAVSIILIQVIFISFSFAYFVNYVYKTTKTKWVGALFLVLLLPPIIYNNLYPLRITMYTYIELLFLTWLYKKYKENEKFDVASTLISAITIFILAFWRTEGIYYLALPLIIYFLFKKNGKILLKSISIVIISVTLVGAFSNLDKKADYKKYIEYKTTAMINPLSILLQEELKGDIEQELEKIDKVMDVEVIRQNPQNWNILIVFKPEYNLYRSDMVEHYDGITSAYLKIILNNFSAFLKQRWEVFEITNGDYDMEYNYYALNDYNDFSTERTDIVKQSKFGKPINIELRNNFLKFLRGEKLEFIIKFWNVKPVLLILAIIMVIFIIKKKYIEVLIIVNLFAKTILIFLTAPASFFMYYYPIYVEGILLIIVCCIYTIKHLLYKIHCT